MIPQKAKPLRLRQSGPPSERSGLGNPGIGVPRVTHPRKSRSPVIAAIPYVSEGSGLVIASLLTDHCYWLQDGVADSDDFVFDGAA
jgi:hypothetical protein